MCKEPGCRNLRTGLRQNGTNGAADDCTVPPLQRAAGPSGVQLLRARGRLAARAKPCPGWVVRMLRGVRGTVTAYGPESIPVTPGRTCGAGQAAQPTEET